MKPSGFFQCLLVPLLAALLTACSTTPDVPVLSTADPSTSPHMPVAFPGETPTAAACPVSEPAWVKPPDDAAIQNPPTFGYYYVNRDGSIWASAWWIGEEENNLRAAGEGIKMGWFRPAGAELEITGRRIDGRASPLQADIPCCYPTRFQATGVHFPAGGCWEITANAAESELSFIVWVDP